MWLDAFCGLAVRHEPFELEERSFVSASILATALLRQPFLRQPWPNVLTVPLHFNGKLVYAGNVLYLEHS